jgi:hypothetical protein
MYVNGMGFRGIERVKGVHHTTVITWVRQAGQHLPDAYDPERMFEKGGRGQKSGQTPDHDTDEGQVDKRL